VTTLTLPTGTTDDVLPETLTAVERFLEWFLGTPLQSLVAIAVGVVVLMLLRWLISRSVRSVIEGGTRVRTGARRLLMRERTPSADDRYSQIAVARRIQRAETMGSVLRSAAALVVGIVVVTALANINGWNLGPVLASAGVAGVALGFGAQTLVKDFLSGLFLLIEDQYGVGDVVDVGDASGTVEAIGLRVTQVRSLDGTLWYVRNGEILRVGNMTQGWSRAMLEISVPPEVDVSRAHELVTRAAQDVATDPERSRSVLDDPTVTAFESLTAEGVVLRVLVKVAPATQWEFQRALRARVLALFAEAGLPLAVPRREVVVEQGRPPGAPLEGPDDGAAPHHG